MAGLIAIPIVFAVLRAVKRSQLFSTLTTLACAVLCIVGRADAACVLALLLSAVGDFFMHYREKGNSVYAIAIFCFLFGHICFAISALMRATFKPWALLAGIVLCAGYALYLKQLLWTKIPDTLHVPTTAYMLVSVFSLTCAMMSGAPLYAVAIALLLFSDTMIAQKDFGGTKKCELLVLPTYYGCHVLVALWALLH